MKQPTPKLDRLREMREARFAQNQPQHKPITVLRHVVASIPAKKHRKTKP